MKRLLTDKPVAIDSPDHIMPHGTKNDNTTSLPFIQEVEQFFGLGTIKMLDLGCAGGQLVIDFASRGHDAKGIDGSDYNVRNKQKNWKDHHNTKLFTADLCAPLFFEEDDQVEKFELITAWEVIEHLKPLDLNQFFVTVSRHLRENGIFVGSISTNEDVVNGVRLHQSVFTEDHWRNVILKPDSALSNTDLIVIDYPFKHKVRNERGSFHIALELER